MPNVNNTPLTTQQFETLPLKSGAVRELKKIEFLFKHPHQTPYRATGVIHLTEMKLDAIWDHNGHCFIVGTHYPEHDLKID